MRKKPTKLSPRQYAFRQKIESELENVPQMPLLLQQILTPRGFLDCYLNICNLYDTKLEAYELLERCHVALTGVRRYSEFNSFKAVLHRSSRDF